MKEAERAATLLGVRLVVVEAKGRDYERAFATMRGERADGLFVGASPTLHADRGRIIELAARYRLPAIYQWAEHVEEGGLMAYGASGRWATRRTLTDTVDRLSASNAELQEKKNHLHNRLAPLEAERDLVTAVLVTAGAAAQQRYEGSIVRFHKLEDCGVLTGPNDVPIHFDLAGVRQHTWDVLQTAAGRDRNGVVEYHHPIPVLFRLRIAARRTDAACCADELNLVIERHPMRPGSAPST